MKLFLRGMVVIIITIALAYVFAPKPRLLDDNQYSTAVYDRTGDLLRLTLSADDKYRLFVAMDDISPLLTESTLLYEDQYFEYHPGINPFALIRAAWDTYIIQTRAVGASTISMQVARMLFHIDSRNLLGKLSQIVRALQLERHYSKKEILETYLNLAPYGRNIEGVGAASLVYFGKQASKLSRPEAMLLSVIPQNPSARMPTRVSGYKKMSSARQRLFESWLEIHPNDTGMKAMMDLPLQVHRLEELPFSAPHFVNAQLANNDLINAHVIKTTLNLKLQKKLENIAKSYVAKKRAYGLNNVSLMLLDYHSMQVLASVGSANFFDQNIQGQVDGTRAKRSPGSTLKPFIYALAMDQSLIHPMTMLKDAPKRFGAYTPENFDRGFSGPIFAKDALIYSRNVPAVNLMAQLKQPSLYEFLTRAGISNMREEQYYGLALALGGHELTMHELVTLYAMLANQGKLRNIKELLATKDPKPAITLLSPEVSFLTLNILGENPRPNESPLLQNTPSETPVYWKTGTSFAFRDAWSIGIFGPYVLAVWVGNFNGEGNPFFVGRKAAAPLFFEIVDAISKSDDNFKKPLINPATLNLTKVDICASTGDLPGRYCPKTIKSWFIPGKSPIRVSNIHRAIPINRDTGLRACSNDVKNIDMKVYEFWPSDIIKLFRDAGLSRKLPPAFDPECSMDVKATYGLPPRIQSPDRNIIYAMRSDRLDEEQIPFLAIADADVKKIFWFVDHQYVGSSINGEPYYWKATLKNSIVRVVDDHGRAATERISVELVQ